MRVLTKQTALGKLPINGEAVAPPGGVQLITCRLKMASWRPPGSIFEAPGLVLEASGLNFGGPGAPFRTTGLDFGRSGGDLYEIFEGFEQACSKRSFHRPRNGREPAETQLLPLRNAGPA